MNDKTLRGKYHTSSHNNSNMTYEGLGEMFEGDSTDMCTEKVLMGGQAESLACADQGRRTPILIT